MCGDVWLTGGVALGAVEAEGIRAAARREDAEIVAEDGIYVGFIDGDPVLDSIPKLAEAHVGVSGEVLSASRRKPSNPPYAALKNNPRERERERRLHDLWAQLPGVLVFQCLRKVEVVKSDMRLDSCTNSSAFISPHPNAKKKLHYKSSIPYLLSSSIRLL